MPPGLLFALSPPSKLHSPGESPPPLVHLTHAPGWYPGQLVVRVLPRTGPRATEGPASSVPWSPGLDLPSQAGLDVPVMPGLPSDLAQCLCWQGVGRPLALCSLHPSLLIHSYSRTEDVQMLILASLPCVQEISLACCPGQLH